MKYYCLAEETSAGDEPMAVDTDIENLKYQKEYEYQGELKIYEINKKNSQKCVNIWGMKNE